MTMTMSSAELLRDQDFQAPTARTAGQGVEGLEELTDLERSDRLARMR
ncbi:MAG: pyruvate formate-lyase 1-activating enzyme, partial [Trueperella pyogenes]|nr:pyruvate formate-lyase 1-activating enzyme [Trueperella pyogenes]